MSPGAPDSFGPVLPRVAAVLRAHGVTDFAFTGGLAVGVWAEPRQTRDIDVCGVLPLGEVDGLLAVRDGIRSGAEELPDIVRFRVGEWDVDLFVSKGAYDRACLGRAVSVEVDGTQVRVVSAEDLLIHKMIKLRSVRRRLLQDLADIRAVVSAQAERLDWSYVRLWSRPLEAEFLEAVAPSTDEELIRKFPQV